MRIGIDVGRVLHGKGGVTTFTRELVRALSTPGVDHDLVLFDLDGRAPRRKLYEDVFGELPSRVVTAQPDRDELEKLDLFHAPGFAMPEPGAPCHIFTLHDLTALSHPEYHVIGNRVRTLTSLSEALARGAILLSVSEATRREALRLLAVPPETIEVVPPIIGRNFTPAGDAQADLEAARSLGINRPYVLAVGSLEPRKNIGRLADAWEQLAEGIKRSHQLVVVAATGWKQGEVRQRLESMAQRGWVVPIGEVSDDSLASLYRRARAFVFPSLAEGFGLPVAEAMACGAPVVTSGRSSLPEVAGEAALYIDPEDSADLAGALEAVISNRDLRRRLRERGYERANLFASETVLPQLLAVYQRAAGR